MANSFRTFIIFLLLLSPVSAFAGDFDCSGKVMKDAAQNAQVLSKIESRYKDINSLTGRFTQSSYFLGLDEQRYSGGHVQFKKGGKMDWLYESPETQRFVSDGKDLWFYQPELNQATLSDFSQSFRSDLPVSFLLGVGDIGKSFRIRSSCAGPHGTIIDLEALQADSSFQSFALLVRDDFSPIGARVVDAGGNETEIIFSQLVVNPNIEDSAFAFSPPKGTDVIDERNGGNVARGGAGN